VTADEIFAAYRAERRDQALPGFVLERLAFFNRYTAAGATDGFVAYTDLPEDRADEMIREQITHFERRGRGFEWKVYELDHPADLRARLLREGFASGDVEAFMVLSPERVPVVRPDDPRVRIERVHSLDQLGEPLAVQRAAFDGAPAWVRPALAEALTERPGEIAIFCARHGDRLVGTGWVDLVPGSSFADLHGGSVVPEARGQGIYSRLLAARAAVARDRGYRWLGVDAAPMSRPILERKGFQHVCRTWPMRRTAPASMP
jgi:GNAT superfamily N-acetyltransferase